MIEAEFRFFQMKIKVCLAMPLNFMSFTFTKLKNDSLLLICWCTW